MSQFQVTHRYISGAVEGDLDEFVLSRLATDAGISVHPIINTRGKANLLKRLSGYNRAAKHSNWIVIVDLDDSYGCAPDAVREWLPDKVSGLYFRIAVREIESWLMADRESFADFFGIPINRIPRVPESIIIPKRFLIDLLKTSRKSDIRKDMVPEEGSGRSVGKLYNGIMLEYIYGTSSRQDLCWNPRKAAKCSNSLAGLLRHLEGLKFDR